MAGACTEGIDTGFIALGYGKVAILGVVQGITELLPISSTAHMRIIPAFLGWQDPGSAFSAAMQLAALAAVISYFWSDVWGVSTGSVKAIVRRDWKHPSFRFAVGIVIATIPIVIFGALLSKLLNTCESPLRSLNVIGMSCIVMAALLAIGELIARHHRTAADMDWLDALLIGLSQVGALIPGISRSGSTLTAGLFLDFKRDDAARISFLLGVPAIALAGFYEIYKLLKAGLDTQGWMILGVGLVVASISAFFAIWGLMRFLKEHTSWPFAIYRLLLGLVLLIGVSRGWFA
jgi:undecaprenyl-diphosphatase